jgi:hypothetical protein
MSLITRVIKCVVPKEKVLYDNLPRVNTGLAISLILVASAKDKLIYSMSYMLLSIILVLLVSGAIYAAVMTSINHRQWKRYRNWALRILFTPSAVALLFVFWGIINDKPFNSFAQFIVAVVLFNIVFIYFNTLVTKKILNCSLEIEELLRESEALHIVNTYMNSDNCKFITKGLPSELIAERKEFALVVVSFLIPKLGILEDELDFDLTTPDCPEDSLVINFFDNELVFYAKDYEAIYLETLLTLCFSDNWPTLKEIVIAVENQNLRGVHYRIFYRQDFGSNTREIPIIVPEHPFTTEREYV